MLRAAGITVKLAKTSGPGSARELAQFAASQGDDPVLVAGGDGTINEVINGITPGNVTLGILPGGTANIIAKELSLPHDPVQAARQLPAWSPRRIALGRATWPAGAPTVQQRYFLSVAGIGFDAYVVHKLSPSGKMSLGVVAFVWEALRQSLRYPFPAFICRLEDREEVPGTFAVVHRTSRYAGWFRLAPSANVFQARFSLCVFKSRQRARYFLYSLAALARQHLRLGDVELLEARKIVCEATNSQKPIYFELDGELAGELPTAFEIVPDALTLLAP